MPGKINGLNTYPEVVKIPGGRVGSTNKEVIVNKIPTEYKGGGNDPSKFTVSPK